MRGTEVPPAPPAPPAPALPRHWSETNLLLRDFTQVEPLGPRRTEEEPPRLFTRAEPEHARGDSARGRPLLQEQQLIWGARNKRRARGYLLSVLLLRHSGTDRDCVGGASADFTVPGQSGEREGGWREKERERGREGERERERALTGAHNLDTDGFSWKCHELSANINTSPEEDATRTSWIIVLGDAVVPETCPPGIRPCVRAPLLPV